MATHTNLEALFTAIADAIRTKTGSSKAIIADNFPTEIANISIGVDTSDATATASQILTGYSAYVKGSKINGSMTNRGAVSQTLSAGGSYTIPAGYHNGSGTVTAAAASGYKVAYLTSRPTYTATTDTSVMTAIDASRAGITTILGCMAIIENGNEDPAIIGWIYDNVNNVK